MRPRFGVVVLLSLVLSLLVFAGEAAARYPRVARDSSGTWVASDQALILIERDLWTFYGVSEGLPADRIRRVAPDEREVWAATARGLARMERNSRRWEILRAPDPLPSDDVYCVAVDDRYVWVGTAAGLAVFDKVARTWAKVDDPQGPGTQRVLEVASLGQTVWASTETAVYRYDRQIQRWRKFGREDGLGITGIDEITQIGDNLWFLGREGLSRMDLRSQAFASFTTREGLPAERITAFALVQGEIWIGTENGMVVYSPGSDSISPFIFQQGMPPGPIAGIEPALPYVWVATDGGLASFNTLNKIWEGKKEADGLHSTLMAGTALAGTVLVLLQPDAFQGYDYQRDEWRSYLIDDVWAGKAGQSGEKSAFQWNLELILDGEGKANYKFEENSWSTKWQLFPDIKLGAGMALEDGRALDASVRVNFGDVTKAGVQEYNAELRVRGNDQDPLRELLVSDQVPVRNPESVHGLEQDAWLEGLGVQGRLAKGEDREKDPVTLDLQAGLNRGVRTREFFRGSLETSLRLQHQYVTPASEVVKVDGMILDRDVDYIITHTTGQLTFLNPDKVNALSLVEINYTYEQIPRKGTGATSILQMLPWDNELGGFKRSGATVYVTDESGLANQVDGALKKYTDRGWVEGVFQDYQKGSTKISVQISDMGTPAQAEEIFDVDKPASATELWKDDESEALLDQNLPSAFAVKMFLDRYYVELTIEDKSQSAEILIGLFAQAIKTKGSLSGTLVDSLRPLVGRVRAGLNPSDHWGVGASFVGQQDLEDAEVTRQYGLNPGGRDLLAADAWTEHEIGQGSAWGGKLSSFVQAGRSQSQDDFRSLRTGQAVAGDLLYNSPALSLRLDGEAQSKDFETLGSRDTVLGTFQSDLRADMTLSPLAWLPFRLIYDREQSLLDSGFAPEGPGTGVNENLLGKLAFQKAGWPTVWVLGGRSLLEADGHQDRKLRVASSFEYDLAHGILESLKFKKLAVLAYYDYSEAVLPSDKRVGQARWLGLGSIPGKADNLRVELKVAPTSTEDGYARFTRKTFEPDQDYIGRIPSVTELTLVPKPLETWELVAAAASRFLPGIVPTFNTKISYEKGQTDTGQATESANSLLSGQLELFPGRWIEALGTTRLMAAYAYTDGEGATNRVMKTDLRKHQVDGALSYGKYDDPFRFESRGKWWQVKLGEFMETNQRYIEVLNRVTYRPIYTSPITLRFDYSDADQLLIQGRMAETRKYNPSLEWESRWSQDFITKIRLEVPFRTLEDNYDLSTGIWISGREWSVKPWEEVRVRLADLWQGSLLRLTLRAYQAYIRPFPQRSDDDNRGMEKAFEMYTSLFLDWEKAGAFILRVGVGHTWHRCLKVNGVGLEDACRSFHALAPSIKALARF